MWGRKSVSLGGHRLLVKWTWAGWVARPWRSRSAAAANRKQVSAQRGGMELLGLLGAPHALCCMQALASCSTMLTCRHWTAVGRLLGSQEHMAVMRSTASGQALVTILDMEVGANCNGQVQVQTGVRYKKSQWHPGRTWPCKRVLAAHLREAEVHCCGKLQAFRPRLLRRGAQDAADFVDLIRLEQAQQGGGRFG